MLSQESEAYSAVAVVMKILGTNLRRINLRILNISNFGAHVTGFAARNLALPACSQKDVAYNYCKLGVE
jgi:hypothetical protein